ncbi:hypothetical protein [Streptomyces lydicus]|uniref:hypothetical protein n=1 Tax=Streptomyces lydicus TaxID=47763 RepID=UPI0019D6D3DD|nr:hypothetical protein [Streptomyces lydicus]MCZ1012213.1 hypothetical protein [Streptomyces lydicus]
MDPHRIKRLTAGDSYVEGVASSRLRAVLDTGAYSVLADAAARAGLDIAVITASTPLRDGVPDLNCLVSCARPLSEHLHPGATTALESTPRQQNCVLPYAPWAPLCPFLDVARQRLQ